MNFEVISKQVQEIAFSAGDFIRKERIKFSPEQNEIKGKNNFVTYIDKESERRIIEALGKILPEAGFIGEEGISTKHSDNFNWVIDPLDGTTNYIHGLFPVAVSIGLIQKKEILLGVVYEVGLNEMFYTHIESKAYLNDSEIQISKAKTISDSLIVTGFPYIKFRRLEVYLKTLEYFMKNSHGVRRLGSAATDLAYVACGRFEGFYEYGLNPWDVAAGALLVRNAGGRVSDFSGGADYLFGEEIIAANPQIHDEFKEIVNKFMG